MKPDQFHGFSFASQACSAERPFLAALSGRDERRAATAALAGEGTYSPPSKRPEYRSWGSMIQRCTNPRNSAYGWYGGRGIKVCDAWRESFLAFLGDVGPRPSPKHSIDRIDNDGNYEPGNVRWATKIEQAQNTHRGRRISLDGEEVCVAELARRLGISRHTVRYRLDRGLDPTMSAPKRARSRRSETLLTFQGETLSLRAWAARTGLNRSTIWGRLRCGWSVERTLTTKPLRQWVGPER